MNLFSGKNLVKLLLLTAVWANPVLTQSFGQDLTVENILTDKFPELGFEVRSADDLITNKGRLVVKDNYVSVPSYKIAAGKKGANGNLFTIRYTVPDPERYDGTTSFEYKGREITTTYLVKKPTPEQAAAYPKMERTDNTIFYIIGGLGLVAGIAGLLLSRRRKEPASLPVPPLPPVPASTPPSPAQDPEEAYKPRAAATPPPAPSYGRVDETLVTPGLMPSLTFQVDGKPLVFNLTGGGQTIGRAPECALVVAHPTVSKIHARVRLRDGMWQIEDLGSTNGTYVDGRKITQTTLHHGSVLYLGQVSGTFNLPRS